MNGSTHYTLSKNGVANTEKTFFSTQTSIKIHIQSEPSIVWKLLTTSSDYQRWNSTIISLKGQMKLGAKIRLKSTLDPKKVYKLRIKKFVKEDFMEWTGMQGKRVFLLSRTENGVDLVMSEKIASPLFPLYAKFIPPFDKNFEDFVADLKREAEILMNEK